MNISAEVAQSGHVIAFLYDESILTRKEARDLVFDVEPSEQLLSLKDASCSVRSLFRSDVIDRDEARMLLGLPEDDSE